MTTATISPEYQVVIPRAVREKMNLRPGQQVQFILHDNRLEMIPERPTRELRGILRGIANDFEREDDRL